MSKPFRMTPVYDKLLRGSPDMPVGLYHLQLATAAQLTRLHYRSGSIKTVKARLKLLVDSGYLQADSIPTRQFRSPYFYSLANKGIRYLREIGIDVPETMRAAGETHEGYQFIEHTLELNDILISAMQISSVVPQYSLANFAHERTLKRTPYKATWDGTAYSLVPDAFLDFHVQTANGQQRLPLLIEHDRGTEEQKHFRRRIQAYTLFLQSGSYVQLFNTKAITVAFTTLKGPKRIEQMRQWTSAELIKSGATNLARVFLFADLVKPLDPRNIWLEKHWYGLHHSQPMSLLQV